MYDQFIYQTYIFVKHLRWVFLQNSKLLSEKVPLQTFDNILNASKDNHVTTQYRSSHQKCFFLKKMFLKIWQNSQENMCQSLFFNKVAGFSLQFYYKRDSGTGVFLWICKTFKNAYLIEHLWTTLSDGLNSFQKIWFLIQRLIRQLLLKTTNTTPKQRKYICYSNHS